MASVLLIEKFHHVHLYDTFAALRFGYVVHSLLCRFFMAHWERKSKKITEIVREICPEF